MRESMLNNVINHQKLVRNVEKTVVEPMQSFYLKRQPIRKSLQKRHLVVVDGVKSVENSIGIERAQCQKQYEILLEAKRLRSMEDPNSKKFETQQKKYHK